MRACIAAGCLVVSLALGAAGCGGSSSYNGSPSPSPTPAPTPSAGTVNIVGINGNRSFNPNPGVLAADGSVIWQNNDGVAHQIVANDGSFDSGLIAPGGSSARLGVGAGGTNYHCSIHPTMIGAINASSGSTPPCQGQYCSQPSATAR